jgi:IS30 family transposase
METTSRRSISTKQWNEAAEQYELGVKHARQIARELGVSPATVSREFKRRGCQKACRVAESIAPLIAELDAKDRAKARQREMEAAVAVAATDGLIDEMMRSIVAAAKSGDLTQAAPTIKEIGSTLGVRPSR